MSSRSNAPTIIKRKKIVQGGGHHGGAWKVAYADFVTAMMAFFLLMWLLNATTENQRQGLADYFSPTVPIARVSGGGEGMLYGQQATQDAVAQSGGGAGSFSASSMAALPPDTPMALPEALAEIEARLNGSSGESLLEDDLLRHIVTRVTDEGLIVDLFDLPDAALFRDGTQTPTPLLHDLVAAVGEAFRGAGNGVAINGHVRSQPIVRREDPTWDLSSARAQATRLLLSERAIPPERIARVSGFADRKPTEPDPMDVRNNRLELILLRDG